MFEISVECSRCNKRYLPNKALTTCKKCGGALLFHYDLEEITKRISKEVLARRENCFWKFLEFLLLFSSKSMVSLGEPYTPVIKIPRSTVSALTMCLSKMRGDSLQEPLRQGEWQLLSAPLPGRNFPATCPDWLRPAARRLDRSASGRCPCVCHGNA